MAYPKPSIIKISIWLLLGLMASSCTTINEAVWEEDIDKVKEYLAEGGDVNAKRGQFGNTLLHTAANEGHLETVKLLIENGANVNLRNNSGFVPLSHAISHPLPTPGGKGPCIRCLTLKHMEIAKLLIEQGADVNARDFYEGWPLNTAITYKNLDAINMLIEHGADVNAKSEIRTSNLHWAVILENLDIVKILIAHGADVNAKNDKGETPLDIARKRGNAEVEALLSKTMKDN